MEPDECAEETYIREFREETGLNVRIRKLNGEYSSLPIAALILRKQSVPATTISNGLRSHPLQQVNH